MKTHKQYYHKRSRLPEVGEEREMINRSGKVERIGKVVGRYERDRTAVIKIVDLDENGKESRNDRAGTIQ